MAWHCAEMHLLGRRRGVRAGQGHGRGRTGTGAARGGEGGPGGEAAPEPGAKSPGSQRARAAGPGGTHRPSAPGRRWPARCPLAGSPPSASGPALASRRLRRPLLTAARPPQRGGGAGDPRQLEDASTRAPAGGAPAGSRMRCRLPLRVPGPPWDPSPLRPCLRLRSAPRPRGVGGGTAGRGRATRGEGLACEANGVASRRAAEVVRQDPPISLVGLRFPPLQCLSSGTRVLLFTEGGRFAPLGLARTSLGVRGPEGWTEGEEGSRKPRGGQEGPAPLGVAAVAGRSSGVRGRRQAGREVGSGSPRERPRSGRESPGAGLGSPWTGQSRGPTGVTGAEGLAAWVALGQPSPRR